MFLDFLIFPIYLDYSSTTPVDPLVIEKLLPYFYYKFGNYSSKTHIYGWTSNYSVESSRINISSFLNCDSREIIFTGSVTESNNIGIKGFCFFYKNKHKNILSIRTEHKSILKCLESLCLEGFNLIFLILCSNSLINIFFLNNFLKKNILLLVISYLNSETGVIQNIEFLSYFCKKNKIVFYVDATQSLGRISINLKLFKIDMMSASSHKTYGPKGVAILYIRRKSNLYFKTLIEGGGQEKKIRSGTVATSLIKGFSESLNIIKKKYFFENLKIKNLKNIFFLEILKIDMIRLNGDFKYRLPHNINISLESINNDLLFLKIKNISISKGSSCNSIVNYTDSIFLKNKTFENNIRIVFGRFNKLSDLYYILKTFFKIFF